MIDPSRMLKVLSCLAFSMTSASYLLYSLEPGPLPRAAQSSVVLLQAIKPEHSSHELAVRREDKLKEEQWLTRSSEVSQVPAVGGSVRGGKDVEKIEN